MGLHGAYIGIEGFPKIRGTFLGVPMISIGSR